MQLFKEAAFLLRQKGPNSVQIADEFEALGVKAKAAASQALDKEALLGDIPDEFLDPIQVSDSIVEVV